MELGHLIAAVATTLSVAAAFAVLTAVSVCVERRDMRAMACAGAALVSSLAVGGLVSPAPASSACAVLALLLVALAVTIAFATPSPLSDFARAPRRLGDPGWWPQFEHDFRAYAQGPRREQNPLQSAVTRRTAAPNRSCSVIRIGVSQ